MGTGRYPEKSVGLRIWAVRHVSLHEQLQKASAGKEADAEGSGMDFGMNARKPSEGVAIATSSEGDEAGAQKPP